MLKGLTLEEINGTARDRLKISKRTDVQNADVSINVKRDGEMLGTLTLRKGTIDWRPKHAKAWKKGETQLTWTQFDQAMKDAKR